MTALDALLTLGPPLAIILMAVGLGIVMVWVAALSRTVEGLAADVEARALTEWTHADRESLPRRRDLRGRR